MSKELILEFIVDYTVLLIFTGIFIYWIIAFFLSQLFVNHKNPETYIKGAYFSWAIASTILSIAIALLLIIYYIDLMNSLLIFVSWTAVLLVMLAASIYSFVKVAKIKE